ncbi:sensor histidine kinase [Polyangium spumosum]|uniref:histidine kinase n=1 Tax=Polyangium spumosum TaxID=889282 RepID=A0A6N7PZH9_9BACT|nr:ATP-binding protein [Polyangium spumosum]MRG95444.1 hypothetical protein [Polyangium spumosum]
MRRHLPVAAVIAILTTLLTGVLVYSSRALATSLEREALRKQRERAVELASYLDAQLLRSHQVANSTAALVEPMRRRDELEGLLRRMLLSTPPQFVYGIGVWFDPYAFDKTKRYYGPYVHRDASGEVVLTFEWSTREYDYPSRSWFEFGKSAGARPAFTEPYFDIDHIYLSTLRSLEDERGRTVGVVSVDLILPQLREILARVNTTPGEALYVTSAEGRIVAHPDELRLLAWARERGRAPRSILDLSLADLEAFHAAVGPPERIVSTTLVEQSGWKVHIASDRRVLFAESRRVLSMAFGITLLLWAVAILGLVAHARHVHARDLARAVELQRRVEDSLRASIHQRDEFISLASHELRTPLTPLLARLELVQRHLRATKSADASHIDRAIAALQRLQALMDELLDAAAVQSGRLSIHLQPTSLTEIVRRSIAAMSHLGSGHRIDADLPRQSFMIAGDASRLEQVVTNLLTNAIKFSPAGGAVRVSIEAGAREAVLSIRDEGIGIPEAEQARAFERYFRASNAPATSFPGLGLGLYISREIVERHGGRIGLESGAGRGSTLHVTLPLLEEGSRSEACPVAPAPLRASGEGKRRGH